MACLCLVYILHHLPINQLFIDPFSEYIKRQDLMDISCSKFRSHTDPNLFDSRIFIINSESTDRNKLSQTLDYLTRKKVKTVGVDLFFDSLHYMHSDTMLHIINQENKNLIFAKTHSNELLDHECISIISDTFLVPALYQRYVNLATDDGLTVRSFQPFYKEGTIESEAFAVSISELYKPGIVKKLKERDNKLEWINYRRSQFSKINSKNDKLESLPHYAIIGMTKFLEDTGAYNDQYFEDKIVLIGFCNGEANQVLKDFYFTSLNKVNSGRSLPDMNGVVIHANIISMLLDDDFVNENSSTFLHILGFILFLINYYIFIRIMRKEYYFEMVIIRLIQLFEFSLIFIIGIWILSEFSYKIGFVFLATVIVLSFELFEFYSRKLKSRLNRLFVRLRWL